MFLLAYCDYIANQIKSALKSENGLIVDCSNVKADLHETHGYFLSTKKTIEVMDKNGKKYIVTIEEKQ